MRKPNPNSTSHLFTMLKMHLQSTQEDRRKIKLFWYVHIRTYKQWTVIFFFCKVSTIKFSARNSGTLCILWFDFRLHVKVFLFCFVELFYPYKKSKTPTAQLNCPQFALTFVGGRNKLFNFLTNEQPNCILNWT